MYEITLLIYGVAMILFVTGNLLFHLPKNRFPYSGKNNKSIGKDGILAKYIKTLNFKKASRQRRIEKEIYEGISFMRNILMLNGGKNIRADVMIEKLANRKGLLQPVYVEMLSCLRINRASDAMMAFEELGVDAKGKEYASLLIKWDEINPEELGEILISIQKATRENRMTEQKRRDEMISDLVYLPVVLNVLIIFVNFLYISYFLDQQEMLMRFF